MDEQVIGCDLYNQVLTGNVACALTEEMEVAGHSGPKVIIVKTDQMDVANGGGQARGICYAIEGNIVDRISSKNGKGYCEDVSPTLNTQDRHAVVYAIEGNGSRPSHMGDGFNDSGIMYTLNTIEKHSICYSQSVIIDHSRRHNYQPLKTAPTLEAHMGTGGGNVPMVLFFNDRRKCDYHEADDDISPTVVAKYGTGGGNVPLVLIRDGTDESISSNNRSAVRE